MKIKRLKTRNFLLLSIIFHLALAIFLIAKGSEYYRDLVNNPETIGVNIVERELSQKTEAEVVQSQPVTLEPVKFEIQPTTQQIALQNRTVSIRTSATPMSSKALDMDLNNLDIGASQAPSSNANRANTLAPIRSTSTSNLSNVKSVVPESRLLIDLKPDSASNLAAGIKAATSDAGSGNRAVAYGRSSFDSGSGTGVRRSGQGSGGRGVGGLEGASALISVPGVSESGEVLADVAQSVALGGEVPPLVKGEPGGIIIGRGKDIKGRIHFVKIDDPHDPGVDI